jgi:hypothetical protein
VGPELLRQGQWAGNPLLLVIFSIIASSAYNDYYTQGGMILAEGIACTALAIMIDPAVFLAELDCGGPVYHA